MERSTRMRIYQNEFARHEKAVFGFLYTITKNRELAEDCTQDTMVQAFQKAHQYTEDTNARAWLTTIARNIYINKYRKIKRRGEQALPDYDTLYLADDGGHALARFAQLADDPKLAALFGDRIQTAIDKLSDDQRRVLYMKEVFDFSEKEIADEMGIGHNAAKTRIRRIRLTLIGELADYAEATYGIRSTRKM